MKERGGRLPARVAVAAGTALLMLVACSGAERARVATPMPEIAGRQQDGFVSNGRTVRLEHIPARSGGRRPAVLMLHGASGVGGGWLLYPHGTALAERGIHVFVVHYFDGLGGGGDQAGTARFGERERIIADALGHVAARGDVDASRIGLFGLSLGGFHALSLATRDRRIAAVANLMGAMPRSVAPQSVRRMPPTLILHGARDGVVPLQRMFNLARTLDYAGAPYEVKIYTDQGHTLSGPAHADSIRTVADFFGRRLAAGTVAGLSERGHRPGLQLSASVANSPSSSSSSRTRSSGSGMP